MIIEEIKEGLIIPFKVPKGLRNKFVNTEVSQEIYFLDCLNDLFYCTQTNMAYHKLRAASILRVLLIHEAIQNFTKRYDIKLEFEATKDTLEGTVIPNKQIRKLDELHESIIGKSNKRRYIKLEDLPRKKYTLREFIKKGCIGIEADKRFLFSVENIINLLANKHGPSHLGFNRKVTTNDKYSFFSGEFNPFSISSNSQFLERLAEIGVITIKAANPIAKEMVEKLIEYDKNFTQINITNVGSPVISEKPDKLRE